MTISVSLANRLGFTILGLTNNFAYVIMLSAAYDLLKQISNNNNVNPDIINNSTVTEPYCNEHSTSTILLADTLPSLATKLVYPFLLVGIPTAYKAIGTAFLSAISFIITGLTTTEVFIFTGVVCASFSSGLGESTYLSNTPLYGDVSLSGWSMGTGGAGLLGAALYALLTMILPIKYIMIIMLIVPLGMILSYFCLLQPINDHNNSDPFSSQNQVLPPSDRDSPGSEVFNMAAKSASTARDNSSKETAQQEQPFSRSNQEVRYYGGSSNGNEQLVAPPPPPLDSMKAKFFYLPRLAKYFLPLLLVYFAEYFINQGLFELIYYPEVTFFSHAEQYRWFNVSYQLGVFISRSSLDLFRIKNIWAMSLLQAANAILFLAHASKLIHIPSFYIVITLIVYEGLLGGFTYVNTFFRVKKEVAPDRQEFCISAVTTADSLGIVFAALLALPVHKALCKLY